MLRVQLHLNSSVSLPLESLKSLCATKAHSDVLGGLDNDHLPNGLPSVAHRTLARDRELTTLLIISLAASWKKLKRIPCFGLEVSIWPADERFPSGFCGRAPIPLTGVINIWCA